MNKIESPHEVMGQKLTFCQFTSLYISQTVVTLAAAEPAAGVRRWHS